MFNGYFNHFDLDFNKCLTFLINQYCLLNINHDPLLHTEK